MAGASGDNTLQITPTWAIGSVYAVFIIISLFIEHAIHSLGKFLQRRQKKALSEALEKIKAELMLLGFISLLLTVGTGVISKICIPAEYGNSMLPCKWNDDLMNEDDDGDHGGSNNDGDHDRRRLLSFDHDIIYHRILASSGGEDHCSIHGKIPLISQSGLHQLHIFIFVLAVVHVLYSVITITLARAKMKKWKAWEAEASSIEYQFTHDPTRFRFAHQTSFVMRHSGFSKLPGMKWLVAFCRQFSGSVTKVDYTTMRHGFINAHLSSNAKFNFHKYIKKSMEDDFKVVVGISFPLWIFAMLFLLLNVHRWQALTWMPSAPLIILLLVGTKLELVIMDMAEKIQGQSIIVKGAPVVEPNDNYFWFNRPEFILWLIHFALFENAFQMAYFLWTLREFGPRSCFYENLAATIFARVLPAVALQVLCCYITFPLYALVTQMGSNMKRTIFEEQMAKALRDWLKETKERQRLKKVGAVGGGSVDASTGDNTPSYGTSPLHMGRVKSIQPIGPI